MLPAVPRTNLRARLTSFIGRESDLARVGKMLADGRLVTLTGPGGAGKTRLSVEAGQRLLEQDEPADGVWLVELAPVTDPAEVPHAALTVLGLRDTVLLAIGRGEKPMEIADPVDRLAAGLADKRLVLLLDNCEHVIEAAALLADRLLADCPGVRILATSREPLAITGEALWPVEPLALPPADVAADEALGFPAVRLLADRAVAVRPGFAVTDQNVRDVTAICRALDGMPLAIELAAARLRALTPGQVAARLHDRFRLLTAGSRTALPRHQTLRAVVEWSWDLLDEPEHALWRRFALFAGGATLESVDAVCGGDLDTLTALIDKSLIVATDDGRYQMLETIRAYGMERLAEAGEEDHYRRAHAEYFLALAREAEPNLRGRDQVTWLRRLTADHDNLHAALRWAVVTGDTALAVRLGSALGWYWWLRGQRSEGVDLLAPILADPDLPDDEYSAMALALSAATSFGSARDTDLVMGWLRRGRGIIARLGDLHDVHPFLRLVGPLVEVFQGGGIRGPALDAVGRLCEDHDPWLRAMAEFMYAQALINLGEQDGVEEHLATGLAGFRALGERWGTAFCLVSMAELASWRGDYRQGIGYCEEGLRLLNELGSGEDVPHCYVKLAQMYWRIGEPERAKDVLTRALLMAERSGTREGQAFVQMQLGDFARYEGRFEEARVRLDRALELTTHLSGPPQFRAMITMGRAVIDLATGDPEAARRRTADALAMALSAMDAPIIAQVLAIGSGGLAFAEGRLIETAEILGAAEAVRGTSDLSLPDIADLTDRTRAALGPEFDPAFQRGRTWTLDETLARLGIERPPPAVPPL